MTKQKKEDMVLFLDQRHRFNPADLLSKFNIHHDQVETWIEMNHKIFRPDWLQTHPKHYVKDSLNKVSKPSISRRREDIRFQMRWLIVEEMYVVTSFLLLTP